MDIKRNGTQASVRAPATNMTGAVRIEPIFASPSASRVRGTSVTFEPGARTFWHTHPVGQTLLITAGSGLVQVWGGKIEHVNPGDVVWFPGGEKHWHGASPTTAMTHVSISEPDANGKTVDWMEPVSDEQYRG
jgi:quercetin dioxygenase-like cupin family protein